MSAIEQILNELPDDADALHIESTASDLNSMNFEPLFLVQTPHFFTMKKAELGAEMTRVLQLPADQASEEIKCKQVEILLYYYELLCRLRLNEPEAWDTINELYEDD